LAKDKDYITTQYRINQKKYASNQAKIPKIRWNDTFFVFFRDNPLPEKTHEEKQLSAKSYREQHPMRQTVHISP